MLAILGVAATYALNRYVSGGLASTVFLLLLIVIAAFSDEPRQIVNGRGLLVFTIPILAASVLLRPWASLVMAGLSSLTIIVVGLGVPGHFPNVPAILGFFVLALGSWLSARSLKKALRDLRHANVMLRESEGRLEEMVEERTAELRETQEQLIQQERMAVLGRLAGGVAHELRNPLAVISNAVYYLKMVLPDADEVVQEYLEIVGDEVRSSTGIISDLLDFSRTRFPERGKIAVSGLIAAVLEKRPLPENVEVITEIPSDLPLVYVDPRHIDQVLANLVTNAFQAMQEGGTLTISGQAEEGQVALSITDTGCGISPESMERLFEPLFTTRARGIGLGLAISKHLVEANEGSIEVMSEAGKGSTFMVKLPVITS